MDWFLFLVMILGVAVLLTLSAPFWMLFRTRALSAADLPKRRALQAAACSVAVVGLTGPLLSNWSFSLYPLNILAVGGAFATCGALVFYAFSLRPRRAWTVVGLLDAVAWCLALLLIPLSTSYKSPSPADLGGGLYCREASFGIGPSDAVYDLEIFRRHLFVDHRVYQGSLFDDSIGARPPAPAGLRASLARCRTLLDQQHEAQANVANPTNRAYTPAVAPPSGVSGTR